MLLFIEPPLHVAHADQSLCTEQHHCRGPQKNNHPKVSLLCCDFCMFFDVCVGLFTEVSSHCPGTVSGFNLILGVHGIVLCEALPREKIRLAPDLLQACPI